MAVFTFGFTAFGAAIVRIAEPITARTPNTHAPRARMIARDMPPGQRGPADRTGVVVKADQRIELMRRKRNLHGAQDGGLVAREIGAGSPGRLADPGIEMRGPGWRGMAAGSATVMHPGTDLCRREDVDRLHAELLGRGRP